MAYPARARRRREANVRAKVNSTEGWTGADADAVYVVLKNGKRQTKTDTHDLDNGQQHTFTIALAEIAPITGATQVSVYDEDGPDGDDRVVELHFDAPCAGESHVGDYHGKIWFPW